MPEGVDHQLFPDGGSAAVEVEGGCWLSESRCIRTAAEIERLRAENESLRQQAGDVSLTVAVVALLVGLGAGFANCEAGELSVGGCGIGAVGLGPRNAVKCVLTAAARPPSCISDSEW